MRLAGDDATRRESPAEPKQQDAPVHFAVLSRVVEDPTRICGIRCPLLLSASVKTYPSEIVVTNGLGTDRCGAWIIERAIRDARDSIDGLPEGCSFHDLRHYLASLLIASGADIKTVQARMRHASARTTLDTYGHLWPDAYASTRTAIGVVIAERMETTADRLRTKAANA